MKPPPSVNVETGSEGSETRATPQVISVVLGRELVSLERETRSFPLCCDVQATEEDREDFGMMSWGRWFFKSEAKVVT